MPYDKSTVMNPLRGFITHASIYTAYSEPWSCNNDTSLPQARAPRLRGFSSTYSDRSTDRGKVPSTYSLQQHTTRFDISLDSFRFNNPC